MSRAIAERVLAIAREERDYVTEILQDLIRIPSPSCEEEKAADYVKAEMDKLEVDEVFTDSIGNVVGRYGGGARVILCDSHMDTVGIGDRNAWKVDPFEARLENGIVSPA
jgi:acetylornithine deacetylase/succinyl-diaminopimelate desuccinylase-like protein